MRKIKAYLSIGNSDGKEITIEVEDNATNEEIDEMVQDWANQYIAYGWSETKGA